MISFLGFRNLLRINNQISTLTSLNPWRLKTHTLHKMSRPQTQENTKNLSKSNNHQQRRSRLAMAVTTTRFLEWCKRAVLTLKKREQRLRESGRNRRDRRSNSNNTGIKISNNNNNSIIHSSNSSSNSGIIINNSSSTMTIRTKGTINNSSTTKSSNNQ